MGLVAVSYLSWKKGRFPQSIKLAGTRAVVWSENAINKWLEEQFNNAPLERVPVPPPAPATSWQTGDAAIAAVNVVSDGASK